MTSLTARVAVLALFLAGALSAQSPATAPAAARPGAPATPDHVRSAAPIRVLSGFVPNHGQWDDEVLFFARQAGVHAVLLRDALVFTPMRHPSEEGQRPAPLVLRLPGAGAEALRGEHELPTQHHFLLGPVDQHVSHVPGYAEVVYEDASPGIDLLVRREATGFAYDLHVAPGADLGALELTLEGARSAHVRADGVLVLETDSGPVEQRIGAAWQHDASGARVDVASAFELRSPVATSPSAEHGLHAAEPAALRLGFTAPTRDATRPFVLDPSLIFSTFIGHDAQDALEGMDIHPDGSTYVTCRTFDSAPLSPDAFDRHVEGIEAWVGKLSADGTTLEWATFLGGGNTEDPYDVHLDTDGTVVVVGRTWSDDFPSTPDALQSELANMDGISDLFLTRLTPNGSAAVWSTYFGGPGHDGCYTSELLANGDVVVVGSTSGPEPPSTPGSYDTQWDPDDWAILRVAADGNAVVFRTFFIPAIIDLTSDEEGNLYLVGSLLPEWGHLGTPGTYQSEPSSDAVEAVIVKMDPLGSQILWGSYLGGTEVDNIKAIGFDAASAIYVVGATNSADFPVSETAFDSDQGGGLTFFVAKLLPGATDLLWATYLDSPGASQTMWDIAVDRAGNAVVTGTTNGPDFPTTPDAFQPDFVPAASTGDATLTKLDAFGESLEYSTYYGAHGQDTQGHLAFTANHELRLALYSSSSDLFVTPGSYDTTYGGGGDMAVTAWDLDVLPFTVLGGGLKGTTHVPNLAGTGLLEPGAPTRLSLRGARPSAGGWFVLGLQALQQPIKGGILVPAPTLFVPFMTDPEGARDLAFPWLDLPAGLDIYIQSWIQDPGGPVGLSASNALQLTSQ